ncbi:MAG: redox-sensing transcriptional repressor Rex [Actinobacteria bacterium]|nr:redox-sensing transcriptional repressor Rex [Actinomycetota bacterium]NCW83609.1 redox-sensing transcriptional repressor Rex [Acidimicrobiia bacterium]NDF66503.1 redox-sensing transcriptional repressor Rex [Actinomycetota bacterium]
MTQPQRRRIPEAAVNRLPVYLQILNNLHATNVLRFSSDELAVLAGVNAAKVRKDLSYLGSYGTRGVGYEVTYLIHQIKRELGLLREWNVVVVGAGNLGCALAKFGGFAPRGFPVVGIVDNDPKKIGQSTGSLTIGDVRNLGKIVRDLNVTIGAITTSTATAQSAVDALIDAGVASILNFAPIVLATPSSVSVRNVDLGVELQILSYYEQMRTEKIEGAKTAKAPSSVSV